MKKILCLIFGLCMSLFLFASCGKEESYKIVFEDEAENTLTMEFPKTALKTASAPIEGTEEIKQSLELAVLKGAYTIDDSTGFVQSDTTVHTSVVATVELAGTGS